MSFGGTSQKCHVCTKTAYEMEAMTYDKMTFHKTCFKCLSCKSQVSLGSVAMISGDLYCKPCFLKKFKEKGQYSSFGEKTLPKAQQDAAKAGDGAAPAAAPAKEAPAKADPPKVAAEPAAAKPARPASTSVTMPAAGNRITCYKCTKVVYEMELITYDKMNFHKSCFRCLKCNNIVGLGSVAMISGDLYCKPCFLKTFKEKGKYSSFGEKTLPKAQQGKAGEAAPAAAAAAPAKTEAAPAAAAAPAAEPAKPAEAAPAAAAEPAKPAEPAPAAAAEPAPAAAAPAEAAPAAAPAESAPAATAAPAEAAPAAAAPAEAAPAAAAPAEAAPAAAAPAEAAPAAAPAEAAPAAAPAEAAPAAAPAEAAPAEAAPAAAPAADAPAS